MVYSPTNIFPENQKGLWLIKDYTDLSKGIMHGTFIINIVR